jgi:hypothetical protein
LTLAALGGYFAGRYWVDRSRSKYASVIYPCERSTCIGARHAINVTSRAAPGRRLASESGFVGSGDHRDRRQLRGVDRAEACWTAAGWTASAACASPDLQCRAGSEGFLCGTCALGFTFNSALDDCVGCSAAPNTGPLVVVTLLGAAAVSSGALYLKGYRLPDSVFRVPPISFLKHFDKGMLKVELDELNLKEL